MADLLVTGIGASAGGIQALSAFFEAAPPDAGIAYVVILHLSPDHDSQLAQVLQQSTAMPVTRVTDKTHLEPDHVYVIPPDKHLTMEDGHILVSPNMQIEDRRAPVDIFFRSLAESHQLRAVGVILSGTGANGSMGLKRIKERGGAVFVQNPREAEFGEMPRNSIATDLVDDVLNVADIPAHIVAYRDSLNVIAIPEAPQDRDEAEQHALREVFIQLRMRTGHDFSAYKRATLMRRIGRRISIRALPGLPAYAAFMNEHPEETQGLLKDLLISVTNFFRDKHAFEAVEAELMPAIFEDKSAGDQVRIWVAGCATGEEAYTLAMLCAERTMGVIDAPAVQIFATDIDEDAIAVAREGFYTLNDAADISPERLSRFFTKEGQGYRIRREIREIILFANHNFLKDPPFSRIDLVSCRNVLIYLNRPAQDRVMETFHFAIKPNGYLMLGTSESVDGASDLFKICNREQHLYQSRPVAAVRPLVIPESVPPIQQGHAALAVLPGAVPLISARMDHVDMHLQLLEQYAPPSLIVDADFNIVHLSERAGRYLQLAAGEPTQAILQIVGSELRSELRNALYQAVQKRVPVNSMAVKVRTIDGTEHIRLHVRPVKSADGEERTRFMLVVFEPVLGESKENAIANTTDEPATRHLEEEVAHLRVQLRNSNEQHELHQEELKAGNEELQAMNEELRSATEELETSKEELQSINEELSTVNQELKVKVEEAGMTSSNLQNLINSTNIGTIFLDRSFRLVLFTPAVRSVFNLIPADIGRPLTDITHRLKHEGLQKDAEVVLERLQVIEREVEATDGRSFLLRLTPYRTEEDHIRGVVISLVDITDRRNIEKLVQESEQRFRHFVEASSEAIYTMSPDWIQMHNLKGMDFLENTDVPSLSWLSRYIPTDERPAMQAVIQDSIENKKTFELEHRVIRVDGRIGWVFSRAIPMLDEQGNIREWFGTATDITKRTEAEGYRIIAEKAMRASEEKYRTLFNSMDEGVVMLELIFNDSGRAVDFRYLEHNQALTQQTGLTKDIIGRRVSEIFPDLEAYWLEAYERVVKSGKPERLEYYFITLDSWFDIYISRMGEEGSHTIVAVYNNTTERKFAEQRKAYQLTLSDTIRPLKDPIGIYKAVAHTALEYLKADRCYYCEVTDEQYIIRHDASSNGLPSVAGVYPRDSFPILNAVIEAKSPFIVQDVHSTDKVDEALRQLCIRLQVISFANVTVIKDDQPVGVLCMVQGAPRNWTATEVALLEETAERTWAAIERARTEEALRESEAHFRAITSLVPALLWQTDTTGQQVIWNPHWLTYTGQAFEGTQKGGWLQAIHPEDKPTAIKIFRNAIKAKKELEIQLRIRRNDGRYRWFLMRNIPITDNSGKLIQWFGVAIDIHAQHKIIENLRIAEERYRIALQSADMGAWDWDVLKDNIRWNDQHFLLLGVQPEDRALKAAYFIQFVHPEDLPAVSQELKQAVEETGKYQVEAFRIIKPNGEIRWMSGYGRAVTWHDGKSTRMVGVMYDITSRVEAMQALREKQLQLNIAQRAARVGIWSFDIKKQKGIGSPEWNELTGYLTTSETYEMEEFIKLVHPGDQEKLIAAHNKAINEHSIIEVEFRLQHPARGLQWFLERAQYIPPYNDVNAALMGSLIEITERKQLEQQKDQFIGIASHELRTPVTSIKAYAEILEETFRENGDAESAKLMQKLDGQVDKLTSLIYALLDTTRITEGKLQLEKTRFDMDELVADTAEIMRRIAGGQRIELELKAQATVHADRERIQQVLINLIGNAIKYSLDADRIIVQSSVEDQQIRVCIQDFGIGISEQGQKHIFERFFRDDAVSAYSGLGLGLFISSGIIHKHGGEIWVKSHKGEGALFCFMLPLVTD